MSPAANTAETLRTRSAPETRRCPRIPAATAGLLSLLVLGLACLPRCAGAQTRPLPSVPETDEVVRASDFIGFVQAAPFVSGLSGSWGQFVRLTRVDPIKGSLSGALTADGPYPLILADNVGDPPRFSLGGDYVAGTGIPSLLPTRFSVRGEYLVFLRRDRRRPAAKAETAGQSRANIEPRDTYTTVAAFAVEVRPDTGGKAVRIITDGKGGSSDPADPTGKGNNTREEDLSADTARVLLERAAASVAKGEAVPADAAAPLDRLFERAAAKSVRFPFIVAPSRPRTVPHEVRLKEVRPLVEMIRPGFTREKVETFFPQRDDGVAGQGRTRYWLGSEVLVEVPYDQTGGAGSPENRVNGAVHVLRGERTRLRGPLVFP